MVFCIAIHLLTLLAVLCVIYDMCWRVCGGDNSSEPWWTYPGNVCGEVGVMDCGKIEGADLEEQCLAGKERRSLWGSNWTRSGEARPSISQACIEWLYVSGLRPCRGRGLAC